MRNTNWKLIPLLLVSMVARAEVSAEIAVTPEYKKCMLKKAFAENQDAIHGVNGMLQGNHEEANVVGYVSLGNQSNMNQNKMFIHQAKKESTRITKELQNLSKVKVNCKELEERVRSSTNQECQQYSDKLTKEQCLLSLENDSSMQLWKR